MTFRKLKEVASRRPCFFNSNNNDLIRYLWLSVLSDFSISVYILVISAWCNPLLYIHRMQKIFSDLFFNLLQHLDMVMRFRVSWQSFSNWTNSFACWGCSRSWSVYLPICRDIATTSSERIFSSPWIWCSLSTICFLSSILLIFAVVVYKGLNAGQENQLIPGLSNGPQDLILWLIPMNLIPFLENYLGWGGLKILPNNIDTEDRDGAVFGKLFTGH